MIEHEFTPEIMAVLEEQFGAAASAVFSASPLLQYINIKTRSASRGSKSRGAFGNLYAIYVIVEDYYHRNFQIDGEYEQYEGAKFSDLFRRQRELPFGAKLQNHALNHRLNEEFKKYFPASEFLPLIRDVQTNRYWVNESLLRVPVVGGTVNIAAAVLKIIDAYAGAKQDAFEAFISQCEELRVIRDGGPDRRLEFIVQLLKPSVDARIFEIVSFSILKAYFRDTPFFWGWSRDQINEEPLTLYKTGRTNANDGGIDFVMRPLGRFFQVTETLDVKKYFLDIDKVQRFPITFVVKSIESPAVVSVEIERQARRLYGADAVVKRYMECVEEVITIPGIMDAFHRAVASGRIQEVVDELVAQSKVEFNYLTSEVEPEDEQPG